MTVAVCLPSRALVMSRTMQDILANVQDEHVSYYFSHGYPIPDCHNLIVEEALKDKPDYLFLVEDDMQLPAGILKELLDADVDIALADYPVRENQHSVSYDKDGVFQYGGLGCALIKRRAILKLDKPYFSVDRSYTRDMQQTSPMGNHGLSDVDFYRRAIFMDLKIKVIDTKAGHYFLKSPVLPKYGNNTALEYVVETWRF